MTQLLPGYRALDLMVRGRRLETYDAWDEDRDCRVVVKVLREDRLDDAEVVAAVLQEGRLATTLAHPHLVRGFDVVDTPRPAIVLELLTGATLDAIVEQTPLGVADAAQLGLQLCSALTYLHRRDWLHLDLKPANVVVDRGRAVLIDLSLMGRPGEGKRGAGTPGYLAPEQVRGSGLSPATDVFGLGGLLLEAVTGSLPFGSEDGYLPPAWSSRGLLRRSVPPVEPPRGVPTELRDLLHSCLALDPADRPSLGEVRTVLARHAEPVA